MRTRAEKNWELIRDILAQESSGKEPKPFSSKRTLFGIPSTLDLEMEKLQKELSEKHDRLPGEDRKNDG